MQVQREFRVRRLLGHGVILSPNARHPLHLRQHHLRRPNEEQGVQEGGRNVHSAVFMEKNSPVEILRGLQ